jgi:hypothetical protein
VAEKKFGGRKRAEDKARSIDRPKIDMQWLYENFKANDNNGFMNFWMDWKERTCPTCGKCFKIHICPINQFEYHYSGAYPQCSCDANRANLAQVLEPLLNAEKARKYYEQIKNEIDGDTNSDDEPMPDDVPF